MYCKKCGTEQVIENKFCRKCGTEFSTQQTSDNKLIHIVESTANESGTSFSKVESQNTLKELSPKKPTKERKRTTKKIADSTQPLQPVIVEDLPQRPQWLKRLIWGTLLLGVYCFFWGSIGWISLFVLICCILLICFPNFPCSPKWTAVFLISGCITLLSDSGGNGSSSDSATNQEQETGKSYKQELVEKNCSMCGKSMLQGRLDYSTRCPNCQAAYNAVNGNGYKTDETIRKEKRKQGIHGY